MEQSKPSSAVSRAEERNRSEPTLRALADEMSTRARAEPRFLLTIKMLRTLFLMSGTLVLMVGLSRPCNEMQNLSVVMLLLVSIFMEVVQPPANPKSTADVSAGQIFRQCFKNPPFEWDDLSFDQKHKFLVKVGTAWPEFWSVRMYTIAALMLEKNLHFDNPTTV